MEKNSTLGVLKKNDFYALLVGFGIAGFHFAVTSLISPLSERFPSHPFNPFAVRDLFEMALIAPGIIPIVVISLLTSNFASHLFIYAFSSFLYGISGGLLTTQRKTLRRIGIVLMGGLILLNCFIWYMLAVV
jgi:hypothetical protein